MCAPDCQKDTHRTQHLSLWYGIHHVSETHKFEWFQIIITVRENIGIYVESLKRNVDRLRENTISQYVEEEELGILYSLIRRLCPPLLYSVALCWLSRGVKIQSVVIFQTQRELHKENLNSLGKV